MNNQWWNATTGTGPAPGVVGHTSGGPGPLWDPNQGILFFSYSNVTAFQESYVPNALVGTPSGIQVRGYTYSYDIRNMNFDNRQGSTDTITATITMRGNPSSIILDTVTNTYNTRFDWTTFSGTRTLTNLVDPSSTGWLGIYFQSRDTGFWAGYYGPQVRNVDVRVNYGVNPCATNPAYNVTCPGFSSVVETINQVPNPSASISWNGYIDNSFAIQTALSQGGSGLQVHGFNYGYTANSGGPYCAAWFLVCFDNRDPYAQVNVNITSNTGQSLYNITRTHQSINPTNFSYQYRFPSSQTLSSLGNFGFDAYAMDNASVSNMWATILYTPDQCIINPLSSPTCPGYNAAFAASIATSSSSTSTPVVTYNTSSGYTSIALAPDSTRTDPTVQNAGGVELTTTGTITAPDGIPTVSREAVATANTQSQTQEREKREVNPNALSTALNTVRRNAEREQSIVRDILQKNETAALQTRASQDALVGDLVSKTQEQSQSIALAAAVSSALSITTNSSRQNSEQAQNKNEDPSGANFNLFGPTNNIQNNLQPRLPETTNKETTGNSVNKNVQPNQAAGNVDITAIAQTPQGFELYMNGMRDGQFYAPKEIYKGQKTVDNARAERFLNGKSDVLHQMMIEQQYNIGN
jgi:hypothetical protein